MPGDGTVRAIADLVFRRGPRRPESTRSFTAEVAAGDVAPVLPTKVLRTFLSSLADRDWPVLLDLGPVVGTNVTFFGERLGCKIFVEDFFADLECFAQRGEAQSAALADVLKTRLGQPDESVDGILCWDLIDYLDRPAAQVLAAELVRLLRPGGTLLGFFGRPGQSGPGYTKYEIVDDGHLRHRLSTAGPGRRSTIPNRDIIKLFGGLLVAESFLLKSHTREMLFRKPPAGATREGR